MLLRGETEMAFCSNCGKELPEGAVFCYVCGAPVTDAAREEKAKYEGEIHKCPNCGEVLGAFVAVCPSCGYELRGTAASSAVSAFAKRIEEIEHGGTGRPQLSAHTRGMRIASLIRDFIIPNTKEDLLEFMILAASHIDVDKHSLFISETEMEISNAWICKFETAYEKAQISFRNSPDFSLFRSIYEDKKKAIAKQRRIHKTNWKYARSLLGIGLSLVFMALLFAFQSRFINRDTSVIKEENTRLNAIVQEVYSYIEEENYTMARAKATELVFDRSKSSSTDCKKAADQWDATRAELTEIIDAAETDRSANDAAP